MKTLRFVMSAMVLSLCLVSSGQMTNSGNKTNTYYVQISHTPDQCLNMLDDMKGKGDSFLSKFEFGCMSGDHTAYGFLQGKSEADVRLMLPKEEQASAKIKKVDKFTADQITKIHKDKMQANLKK